VTVEFRVLFTLLPGCVEPTFVCTTHVPPGGQVSMLGDDLALRATDRLAHDLQDEAAGTMRNAAARKYLRSIPREVTQQRYTVSVDGNVIFVASFGSASLAATPPVLGRLVHRTGRVVGVGFEPTSVRLKFDGRTVNLQATPEQVEMAIASRGHEISAALIDDGDRSRLIWLRSSTVAVAPPSLASTVAHLTGAWSETLRILAQ
jgi:hypothetical protein